MKQKPRSTKESLFSKDLIIEIIIIGITITGIVFGTWKFLMDKGVEVVKARSIILMLMVLIQNINVLNCRSEKKSIFKTPISTNPLIFITIIGSILLQVIMAEIPITAKFLNVVPLSVPIIAQLLLLSFVIIIVFEIYKLVYNTLKKD